MSKQKQDRIQDRELLEIIDAMNPGMMRLAQRLSVSLVTFDDERRKRRNAVADVVLLLLDEQTREQLGSLIWDDDSKSEGDAMKFAQKILYGCSVVKEASEEVIGPSGVPMMTL